MDEKMIQRINELANKSKTENLTPEEEEERTRLRKEYITLFREGFKKDIIDNIYILDEDGNEKKLT